MADVTLMLAICMSMNAECTGNAPASTAGYQCTFSGPESGNHVGRGNLKFAKDTDSDSKVTIQLSSNRFQFASENPVTFYEDHKKTTPYTGPAFDSQNVAALSTSFMDKISHEDNHPHVYLYSVTVTDTRTSATVLCDPTISHN